MRVKVIDMNNKSYKTLYDIECPITKNSNLIWFGFSEEGMLCSFDNEGIVRTLNPLNKQWIPVMDFQQRFPDAYAQLWIVGISENKIMLIEMSKN